MIIKDTETIQKHISVNPSFTFKNAQSSLRKAERNFLRPLIGADQLADLEAENITDPIVQEALDLAQEAVANFGFYLYMPIGVVQITDGGFFASSTEHAQPITDKQFKELQRSFKSAGHEALDDLLNHMEANASKFDAWTSSGNYSIYKDLLVCDTSTFNRYYYIFNSRQTFIAIRPNIQIVEDQFIKGPVGNELLTALKTDQTELIRIKVKKLLQQAIVAFSVMKTVDNGMFVLDAKGIHMRFDALPYETSMTNTSKGFNDFLIHTKKSKEAEGTEYLKFALKLITDNPDDFSEYTPPAPVRKQSIKVTPGLIGL